MKLILAAIFLTLIACSTPANNTCTADGIVYDAEGEVIVEIGAC